MRVLVLDGNQNQAVACVRSLARAGHRVLVGESSSWSKAGWSRFCHDTFQYPAPQENAGGFVERIASLAGSEPGTFILPVTDATTLPLSANRDVIGAAGAHLVLPEHADVLRALDKEETVRLACSLGFTVPKTVTLRNLEDAKQVGAGLSFPIVLKPRRSQEFSPDRLVRATGRPRYAQNAEECVLSYLQMSRCSSDILAQEFVEGSGLGYFALMRHGELRAEFAHRRIRDAYPSGSGSALRVSVEPDPGIRKAALAILGGLHWHGVAMVEFRQQPGRTPVFMEVNGRLWHSLALACCAGADFPAWLAELAERGEIQAPRPFRAGVQCRWWLGDFRHLLEVWRGAPRGFPGKYPPRLRTLLEELTPSPGAYHDNFRWDDPLPEVGDWLNFFNLIGEHALSQDDRHA